MRIATPNSYEALNLTPYREKLYSLVAEDGDREGLPNVLMEAMAFGVPVISTWTVGIPELVVDGKAGLLVSPADPQSLALATGWLIQDEPLRNRLSTDGRAKVEAEFDIEKTAPQLIKLFAS